MGGHAVAKVEPRMIATEEEMVRERVPLEFRDYCAHVLIPLNQCRRKNRFAPFRCVDERHTYEKCQYEHYMRRVGDMKEELKAHREAKRLASDEAQ